MCRYFDDSYKELGPQVGSVVFPNFVVYCCSRSSAAYMSVTLGPTEEIVKYVKVTDRRAKGLLIFCSFLVNSLEIDPKFVG